MRFYLVVALIVCYVDSVAYLVSEVKFNMGKSIAFSLAWPIMVPLIIYATSKITEGNTKPKYRWPHKYDGK